MEENTHAFANDNVDVLPHARSDRAYLPNGSSANWKSLHQKKDIAQPGVEPNVYAFSNDNVEVLPWTRRETPYPANGW